ncbi:hypothetical protein SCA6_002916 [Theobroma cacao]
MIKKKEESSPRVLKKKLHNSSVLKKLEVEVIEKRGYTMCLKQLLKEEATVKEGAIQEMETKLARMKRKKEILSSKNECVEQFITCMLVVFQAEDRFI